MLIGKNYRLISEIGSGTFGKVWLGEHVPTGCQIAIKILEKDKILDDSDVERVTRELKIAQSISHPHLVQLFHLLETKEYVFLIMEYLPGGELYDLIVSRKKLTEEEAFLYIVQIVNSVEYLHSLNIAHRDLKPENLLLDQDKKVIKLVDFGLGRFYDTGVNIETACGSPCYAPPEMLSKLKYDPLKADIWSLGIVFFAMLAGYLPFDDENTDILYQKIIEGKFVMPGSISVDAADLLSRIIQTNPSKRLTLREIKNHSWWLRYSHELRGKSENCCLNDAHQNLFEIDSEIVEQMSKQGIDAPTIIQNVKNRVYSEVFCHYQLLKNKSRTARKRSVDPRNIESFKKKRNLPGIEIEPIQTRKFQHFSGPIDLGSISLRPIEDVYNELKEFFFLNGFSLGPSTAHGTFALKHQKSEVSFKLSVMHIVDSTEGCCIICEDIKPDRVKFDTFYNLNLKKRLQEIIG